jgi:hypothetical protein
MFWLLLEPMCVPTDETHCQVFVILVAGEESTARANPELLHLHQTLSLYSSYTHFLRIDIV